MINTKFLYNKTYLFQSAYNDACRLGNPRDTSVEEIAELYKSLM